MFLWVFDTRCVSLFVLGPCSWRTRSSEAICISSSLCCRCSQAADDGAAPSVDAFMRLEGGVEQRWERNKPHDVCMWGGRGFSRGWLEVLMLRLIRLFRMFGVHWSTDLIWYDRFRKEIHHWCRRGDKDQIGFQRFYSGFTARLCAPLGVYILLRTPQPPPHHQQTSYTRVHCSNVLLEKERFPERNQVLIPE